jgi:bifunctional non-homologous end joining protein LigD
MPQKGRLSRAARSARPCCTRSTSWSGDGEDLRGLPLGDRKKRLARLLGRRRLGIVLSAHRVTMALRSSSRPCKLGLEGIVSKRLSAPYRSGPSGD